MSAPPTLRELLQQDRAPAIPVPGLALDSRTVQPGEVFVALAGTRSHGLAFAAEAAARGAAAVLAETPLPADVPTLGVPVVPVPGLRERLGMLAARLAGEPSRALRMIGVTGTNGKTSTVQLLAQALAHEGQEVATIGTLGAGRSGAIEPGRLTTPDAIAVQGLLQGFRAAGVDTVAMEVSSHALDQGRVNGIDFDLAVFTNLSRDHLDYHGSMDAYGAAKARLFEWPGLGAAIINVDDAFGRELAGRLEGRLPLLRYGLGAGPAEVQAREIQGDDAGQRFQLCTPWGGAALATPLLGRFNLANLLAVAACLGHLGLDFERLCAALAALQPVPGRMSRVGGGLQPLVVVDYAHTPDALEQALSTLRVHCRGQLVCVFGCGGERDAGKRPQMGAVAARMADRIILTDDNPRGESGTAIIAQVLAGMPQVGATVERDRARAIALAIAGAGAGDVVLVAGKGHETTQESAGVRRPFDDLAVARSALEARR